MGVISSTARKKKPDRVQRSGFEKVRVINKKVTDRYRVRPNRRRSSSVQPISATMAFSVPMGKVSLTR